MALPNSTDKNNGLRIQAEKECSEDIDAIWVYGSHAQAKLTDFSKTISNALIDANGTDTERIINAVIENMDQSVLDEKKSLFSWNRPDSTERYKAVIKQIDNLTVNLRLRQAQLLKSLSIFKQMEILISECISELDIYISVAEQKIIGVNSATPDSDNEEWRSRLEKKISELRMSNIIAAQGLAQIKLMKEKNTVLAEKIGDTVSNVLPLWRNQAVVAYGLEQYESSNLLQQKLLEANERIARKNDKTIRKEIKRIRHSTKEIDIANIKRLHAKLEDTLYDLQKIEQSVQDETKGMNELLWQIKDIKSPIKLTLYSKNVKVIAKVFREQRDSLVAVCLFAFGYIVLTAIIIFNVEPETFNTFFDAVYWATVSLTTVGYGDIYASSVIGRIIAMISSIFGIAIIALPAGIITAGYLKEIENSKEANAKQGDDKRRHNN